MRYILILALIALASCVHAISTNCLGSSTCAFFKNVYNPKQNLADSLRQEIAANVSDSRVYQNGQHIVCIEGEAWFLFLPIPGHSRLCAFLKNTSGGLPGNEIKKLAQRIVDNGCKTCGSVPVDSNSESRLTFNFVDIDLEREKKTFRRECSSIPGNCQYD